MFNCVGFANYRYFVLFLFYVTVACVYGAAVTLPDFLRLAGVFQGSTPFRAPRLDPATHTAVMFTCVLSLSVGRGRGPTLQSGPALTPRGGRVDAAGRSR